MMHVKHGDTHTIVWRIESASGVPQNLSGCTSKVWCRERYGTQVQELASEITNAAEGLVSHTLTGTLAPGVYIVEVEITNAVNVITTAPTRGSSFLTVEQDLDES